MATRLEKWFAKPTAQHNNHDETGMPGMPETPGGRSWQIATGEAMLATASNGANGGIIPNQQSGRLMPDRVTREPRQKNGYTSKEKEEFYAHGDMECANDEGPRETAPAY